MAISSEILMIALPFMSSETVLFNLTEGWLKDLSGHQDWPQRPQCLSLLFLHTYFFPARIETFLFTSKYNHIIPQQKNIMLIWEVYWHLTDSSEARS